MITVTYRKKYNMLHIEGHAYSGEAGHDLVCSAASILAYTLAANLENAKACGYVKEVHLDMKPGDAVVRCTPAKKYQNTVELVIQTILTGFSLLARDYDRYIKLCVKAQ